MIKNNTQRMVTAGLLAAVGIILPLFSSHLLGVPGTTLLPMHIPILLCGLICGAQYGVLCAVVVPVLSCVLTGMPGVYPMLPIMLVQLVSMGLAGGLMYQNKKIHLLVSLPGAIIFGWVFYGAAFYALLFADGGSIKALPLTAALIQGLPGIIIQLVLIPAVIGLLKRTIGNHIFENQPADTQKVQSQAVTAIKSKSISCAIIRDGSIIHTSVERGVSPLLNIYKNDPGKLKNAVVVDKIIGKAAAMILVLGGAKKAYGMIMSAAGREYLENHGIIAEFGLSVDLISNRTNDGICPVEKLVLEIDDPNEGFLILSETMNGLTKMAANQ